MGDYIGDYYMGLRIPGVQSMAHTGLYTDSLGLI